MTNSTGGGSFLLWTVFLAVFGYLGRTWNQGFMGFIQGQAICFVLAGSSSSEERNHKAIRFRVMVWILDYLEIQGTQTSQGTISWDGISFWVFQGTINNKELNVGTEWQFNDGRGRQLCYFVRGFYGGLGKPLKARIGNSHATGEQAFDLWCVKFLSWL